MHCNPAPPHPEPGVAYGAICPPSLQDVALVLGLMFLIVIGIKIELWRRSSDE